jgi:hypothetical protein
MARNFGHEDAGLATPETLSAIVENFAIRTFLESSSKRYLVGPKGSGKTLILLRKAIDERRRGAPRTLWCVGQISARLTMVCSARQREAAIRSMPMASSADDKCAPARPCS